MSRRSSSRLTAGLEIEYINHLSTKSLGKVPTTFGEFLEDIGPDTLKKFPIMDQIGGTCVIFSIATAISIAKGKMEPTPTQCERGGDGSKAGEFSAQQKNKGADIENILKQYKDLKYTDHNPGKGTLKLSFPTHAKKLTDALKTCVLVIGGASLGTPTTETVKYKKGKRKVPGFWGGIGGYEDHAVCIVGCYKDEVLGPCFVTKTTNHVWEPNRKLSFNPYKGKRKVKLGRDFISFAVYPIKKVDAHRSAKSMVTGVGSVYGIKMEWDPKKTLEEDTDVGDVTNKMKKMTLKKKKKVEVAPVLRRSRRNRNPGKKKAELPQLKF